MKIFTFYLVLFFLIAVSCGSNHQSGSKISQINEKELIELIQNQGATLVDVRTPEETSQGFISGAILINFFDENFTELVDQLDKDKPLVLYCQSGRRSAKAAIKLSESGFGAIHDLKRGFIGWTDKGFPVTTKN